MNYTFSIRMIGHFSAGAFHQFEHMCMDQGILGFERYLRYQTSVLEEVSVPMLDAFGQPDYRRMISIKLKGL